MPHKAPCILAVFSLLLLGGLAPAHAEFRAGIATAVVTPDPLLPVSGGVGIPEPVEKKAGELEVRALVVEQGDTRVAIVSVPFLGFPSILCDRVRAKVNGIPPENVIIGSTHVHSAPDMYAFGDENGETLADLDYIDKVCGQTAEAINQALAGAKRAGVKIATDQAKGKIAYNYYAEKLYDPRCSVLQFVDTEGKAFATLVNYAIHPEVIGPERKILSPDLVGPLYDRIAQNGGGMGIFMNSAQGGMVTADCRGPEGRDIQTWEECIRIGNLLADEALRIVSGAAVQEDPALLCANTKITFPIESPLMLAVIANSPLKYPMNPDKSVTTLVNVVNLGNAQILTIPGEAMPNIGFYLKRKMKGEHNLLFGLTNDAFGYILTREDFNSFERYNYVSRTSLGEKTGTILVDEALKFVDSLPAPAKQ